MGIKQALLYFFNCTALILAVSCSAFSEKSDINSDTISWQLFRARSSAQDPNQINSNWELLPQKRISEGMNPDPTWLRFEFENSGTDTITRHWVVFNAYVDTIDFWKNGEHLSQSGLSYPFYQRPFENENFVLPLKIAPSEKITIYTRLALRTGSLTSDLLLLDTKEFDKWVLSTNRFYFTYLGLITNVFFIALVVSLITGRSIMIYYAAYLLSFILFQLNAHGYAYHYFWPGSPFIALLAKGIFQLLACFFFWLFCMELTGFSKITNLISQRFKKQLLLLLPTAIVVALVCIFFDVYRPIYYLFLGLSFTYIATGFVDLCLCIRYKFRPAYGVFLAFCFPVFAILVVILRGGRIIPDLHFLDYAYPFAFVMEVVLILVFTIYFMRRQNHFLALQKTRLAYHQEYLKKILPELKHISSQAEVQRILSNEVKVAQGYPPELLENDFKLIYAAMTEQKLYVNPDLSLQILANEAGVPFSRASRSINAVGKKSFSKWLNELRVEEAKQLLHSTVAETYTLEAIAQMAGFASRSNFNAIFKQVTNTSPSDFRSKNR